MNYNEHWEESGWYEPLRSAPDAPAETPVPQKKRRRGWTPARVLGVIALVMLVIVGILAYLAIKKGFEPLLLLPIAIGMLLTNLPGGGMLQHFLL